MSAHCNVLCYAFLFLFSCFVESVDNCFVCFCFCFFSTSIFLQQRLKYVRRKIHFIKKKSKKKSLVILKLLLLCIKRKKGMILTFSENLDVVLDELIEFEK